MKRRILVTGGSGFIGRHVLSLLVDCDYEVFTITRSRLPKIKGVTSFTGNLLNHAETARHIKQLRASHLIHLAWYTETGAFWHSDINSDWLTSSLHLVRSFVDNGGEHILIAGSCAEYDWNNGICNEATTACTQSSLYATSKHNLHCLLEQHAGIKSYQLTWARVFFPFGPFEPKAKLLPSLINSMLAQTPIQCSEGSQKRDFIYIEDVASAIVALSNGENRGAFNIGTGEAFSIREIVRYVYRNSDHSKLVSFSKLSIPPSPPLVVADITKIKRETNWRPKYNLNQGIDKTISWWEAYHEAHN